MDKNRILIFAVIAAVLGIRLYMKYKKKDKIKSGTEEKPSASSSFPTSSKDDEYEPYSKK
jgi:hypothetical protein